MNRIFIAVVVLMSGMASSAAVAGADRFAERSEWWQKYLERTEFRFIESDAGVLYSLSQFGGNCKIHMIYDPVKWSVLTFKFERDGKELLTIEGHKQSVFRTDHNILYFAHFALGNDGCTVTAHDLADGKQLWETKLSATECPAHFAYSNEVTIYASNGMGPDHQIEGAVTITGHESYGDYVEILDEKTGKVLAHKLYRQGFEK